MTVIWYFWEYELIDYFQRLNRRVSELDSLLVHSYTIYILCMTPLLCKVETKS